MATKPQPKSAAPSEPRMQKYARVTMYLMAALSGLYLLVWVVFVLWRNDDRLTTGAGTAGGILATVFVAWLGDETIRYTRARTEGLIHEIEGVIREHDHGWLPNPKRVFEELYRMLAEVRDDANSQVWFAAYWLAVGIDVEGWNLARSSTIAAIKVRCDLGYKTTVRLLKCDSALFSSFVDALDTHCRGADTPMPPDIRDSYIRLRKSMHDAHFQREEVDVREVDHVPFVMVVTSDTKGDMECLIWIATADALHQTGASLGGFRTNDRAFCEAIIDVIVHMGDPSRSAATPSSAPGPAAAHAAVESV